MNRRYRTGATLVASMTSSIVLLLMLALPMEALSQTVLFVYDASLNTGREGRDEDYQYLNALRDELGFEVLLADHQAASQEDAEGVDLIIISESVSSGNVVGKFKNTTVPIVNAEVFTWSPDRMAWIPPGLAVDREMGFANASKINIASSNHPILGGLRPGDLTVYNDPPGGDLGNDAGNQIGYAVPLEDAEILATLPGYVFGPDGAPLPGADRPRATLFTLEPGDQLADGSTVPARYVGFFAHTRGSENMTEVGETLFINSVLWALGRESETRSIEAPPQTILAVYDASLNTGVDGRNEDLRYFEMLDELGLNVFQVDHQSVTRADAEGVDAIFISESVGSGNIGDKFKGIRLPIVNAEVFTYTPDRMAWSPAGLPVDVDMGFAQASKIQIANKTHPILGGLPTYEVRVYDDPPGGSLGADASNQIGYTVPAKDAEILATLPSAVFGGNGSPLPPSDKQRATLFVFEPGDRLADQSVVWMRQASFFAHVRGSDNLSEIGESLFKNTVLWVLGREAEAVQIEAPPPTMLFVYDASLNTGADGRDEDIRYLEMLTDSLGFDVFLADHNSVSREDTVGVDAIFISESVGSGNIAAKFKGVPVPIINAEVFTWTPDRMWWIEPGLAVDTDMGFANSNNIQVEDIDHPILGGLLPGNLRVYEDPPMSGLGNDESNQVGFAVPLASARILATLSDDATAPNGGPLPASDFTRATLFTYERGDTLVSNDTLLTIAPARRVGFFAHTRGSENLTEAGEQLFMNAVSWATGRELEIRSVTPVANEREAELPESFAIESVYPNPFNPSATAVVHAAQAGPYEVNIYDVLGRLVKKHMISVTTPGQQQIAIDLRNEASGMYLIQVVQVQTGKSAVTRAVLVK